MREEARGLKRIGRNERDERTGEEARGLERNGRNERNESNGRNDCNDNNEKLS